MENICDKIKTRVKNFDIYLQKLESETVNFENNKLKLVDRRLEKGYGIRLIKDNKIGFSASNNFGNIDSTIENALKLSAFGEKCYFEFPNKRFDFKDLKIFSDNITSINSKKMIELGKHLLSLLSSLDNDIKTNVIVEKNIIKNELINSSSLNLKERKTRFSITGWIFKAEENNFIEIWEQEDLKENEDLPNLINKIFERIKFLFNSAKNVTKIEPGYYPVFFTPKSFSTILSMLIKSFDGNLIYKKISFFTDKKGRKFFKKPVTILDDPLKIGYPYSRNFDGDGIKSEPIYLIEKGVIKQFLLDIQTAGKLKSVSNGHSVRSYVSLPSPGHTNIFFTVEDKSFVENREKIIKGIRKGILIDQFLGAGQSNILAGEFSVNIDLGFLIENGEIVGRIKDCMIAGNLFELLNDIEKIDNSPLYYGSIETPGVLVSKLPVK